MTDQPDQPLLSVVRGTPDEMELAALTAVAAAIATSAAKPTAEPARSPWSDPRALVRRPIHHGPGAWRASGLPG